MPSEDEALGKPPVILETFGEAMAPWPLLMRVGVVEQGKFSLGSGTIFIGLFKQMAQNNHDKMIARRL